MVSKSINTNGLEITYDMSLQTMNTLSCPIYTQCYTKITSIQDLKKLILWYKQNFMPFCFLGGGSNTLWIKDFDGIVIQNGIKGVEKIRETKQHVWLRIGAGEIWNDVVDYTLSKSWYGLENLVLIPGLVGASIIQNIGAYGIEISSFVQHVEGCFFPKPDIAIINAEQCDFNYRHSVFKHSDMKSFFITHIVLRLSKEPKLELSYESLKKRLLENNIKHITPIQVANLVSKIRQEKLPDYHTIPNAGSFFTNPIVSSQYAAALKREYATMPCYPMSDNKIKISGAWLIEQCGWKGKHINGVGMYSKQSLVLTNEGQKNGKEVLSFAQNIIKDVKRKFNITLSLEVTIMPS